MQYLYISELDVEGSPACLAPLCVCVGWGEYIFMLKTRYYSMCIAILIQRHFNLTIALKKSDIVSCKAFKSQ